ncbi:ABC transporter permease (plasmid) [Arthrobacter sp. Z1-9]
MSVLYLLAAIIITFGIISPNLFLSMLTFQAVASSQAIGTMLALAALLPLVVGEFDITVGVNMALGVAIVTWQSALHPEGSLPAICIVAVVVCTLAGLVNGVLVVKLNVSSFIATLAMSQVLAAIALKISNNQQLRGDFSEGFSNFGQARWLGVPAPLYCAMGIAVILWYLLERTKLGRHMFATGMNREAARLSGVRTDAMVLGSFVASGFIAGLAGIVYAAQVGIFANTIGMALIFPAFAAIFLGATQFNRRPNVWGTILAILTLAIGAQGLQLTLLEGGFWITPMFNGIALVLAVIFGARQIKRAKQDRPTAPSDRADGEPATGGVTQRASRS